jgi:hypothetical protein
MGGARLARRGGFLQRPNPAYLGLLDRDHHAELGLDLKRAVWQFLDIALDGLAVHEVDAVTARNLGSGDSRQLQAQHDSGQRGHDVRTVSHGSLTKFDLRGPTTQLRFHYMIFSRVTA